MREWAGELIASGRLLEIVAARVARREGAPEAVVRRNCALRKPDGVHQNVERPGSTEIASGQHESAEMEARARLVRDVLASRTFSKSTRLSELLRYICRVTLEGGSSQLNEQEIGVRVFGRSPSYHAAEDSIVRSQARLLRQKLEEYFEHECPHTAEVITVPKGGYVPVFRPREAVSQPVTAVAPPPPDLPSSPPEPPAADLPRAKGSGSRKLGWLLVLLVMLGIGVLLWRAEAHGSRGGSLSADLLWGRLFEKNQQTLIVASDDGLVLFQELTHVSVSLNDYLDGNYLRREIRSASGGVTFDPAWFAAHQYTSMADLDLTLRLSRLSEAGLAQVEARNARSLHLEDLKTQNVILIGGPGSNPLVGLFADRLSLQLGWDWTTGEGFVRDTRPSQNEMPVYHDALSGSSRKSYGLIAYLPGLAGNKRVLLVEGTGMAGTEAAADFLFSKEFGDVAQAIGATHDNLPFFEVLLETTSIGGNAPQSHVVVSRRIQP